MPGLLSAHVPGHDGEAGERTGHLCERAAGGPLHGWALHGLVRAERHGLRLPEGAGGGKVRHGSERCRWAI